MRIALVPVLFFALVGVTEAQQKKGKCSGSEPDSLWLRKGPVYRDCEVDKKAKLRGSEPQVNFTPRFVDPTRGWCATASLEFVVDTLGQPELLTVRTRSSSDADFEDAVRANLPKLRYTPARLGDRAVRQLVVYQAGMASVPFSEPVGSNPPPPTRAKPPGC